MKGFFAWLERKKYKLHIRVFLSRYRGYATCLECNGTRLRPEARAVRVSGKSITEACALTVAEASQFSALWNSAPSRLPSPTGFSKKSASGCASSMKSASII